MKLGIEKPGSWGSHTSRISAPLVRCRHRGPSVRPKFNRDVVVLLVSLALEPLFRRERARVAPLGSKPVPRKYPAMVLLLEKLIKIDIHRLVQNDCWAATVGEYRLELNPIRNGANYFLTLNVNGVRTTRRWMLSNRPIRGRLQRGGSIPWDKSEVWYVHSANGRRCSHLYINAATCLIGTRDEHGARYRGNCLSGKKRQAEKLFREALHAIRRNKS